MTINLKGLYTPSAPEDRDLAYLEVTYNGEIYDWAIYIPRGVNVGQYLATVENVVYAQIDAKEVIWTNLEPKTKTITDPMTNETTVIAISKNEIVKPDIVDYYAQRRAAYPSIGDQLDAFWKGPNSEEYALILNKIQAVKSQYPKP